jgi:ribonucleoside-triphosphate reductase (thioredoxin)
VVPRLRAAGYHVEPAVEDPQRKLVVTFPVDAGAGVRTLADMSMWEQLSLAAFLQRHWADNQVSCTVTFDPEREARDIAPALNFFQYQLKGVSLLPRAPTAAYAQLPYEAITAEQYAAAMAGLKQPLDLDGLQGGAHPSAPERFCDTSRCDIEAPIKESAAGAPDDVDADGARVAAPAAPHRRGGSAGSAAAGGGSSGKTAQ